MEEHIGIPFKNLLLDGPVLADMTFDPTQDHVYAMTPETVSMVYRLFALISLFILFIVGETIYYKSGKC